MAESGAQPTVLFGITSRFVIPTQNFSDLADHKSTVYEIGISDQEWIRSGISWVVGRCIWIEPDCQYSNRIYIGWLYSPIA